MSNNKSFIYNRPSKCNNSSNYYWSKPLLDKFFKISNAKKSDNLEDTNIFLPCSYNNSQKDIENLGKTSSDLRIFGIHNADTFISKKNIWLHILTKYGREKAKTLMPETYILNNKDDLEILLRDYKPNNKFILKNKLQAKMGLKITDKLSEVLSGDKDGFIIAQKYISNIYTINRRKLNLRVYLLVVCKNGKKDYYIYNNGICIYANNDYDIKSNDREAHITSFNLDGSIYKVNPLSIDDLYSYFDKNNKDSKLIFKKILNKIRLIMDAVSFNICNFKNVDKSTSFELFGGDVIFDNNLEPYVLEFNKGPDMNPFTYSDPRYRGVKEELIRDIFDLVGLYKSNEPNRFQKIN